jgi:hypothetical protein
MLIPPKVKGEEAPKTFLRECRAYSEKSTLIPPKVKGEEAPKGGLQRKVNADDDKKKFMYSIAGMCVKLRNEYLFS